MAWKKVTFYLHWETTMIKNSKPLFNNAILICQNTMCELLLFSQLSPFDEKKKKNSQVIHFSHLTIKVNRTRQLPATPISFLTTSNTRLVNTLMSVTVGRQKNKVFTDKHPVLERQDLSHRLGTKGMIAAKQQVLLSSQLWHLYVWQKNPKIPWLSQSMVRSKFGGPRFLASEVKKILFRIKVHCGLHRHTQQRLRLPRNWLQPSLRRKPGLSVSEVPIHVN